MDSKVVSSISLERITYILHEALHKFFGNNPDRLKIYKGANRLNMSCPYCGDSHDARKKRGNFYLDTLTYKCYNGGCEVFKNLNEFTKDFNIQHLLSAEEISEIVEISSSNKRMKKIRSSIDYFYSENYKDILISREYLKNKVRLTEVKGTYAEKWLLQRNHIPDKKFLWDPNRKSLYLLNLSGNEDKIFGLQIRPIVKKSYSKYFTYKLSGIYKNLLNTNDKDIILKAEEVDPVSSIFGFSNVDLDSMITVFEGPLDSWLCPNSIALCSINNPFPFDIENKRWLLDGDNTGKKKAREFLEKGESVFLWDKFLSENNFPNREKWDLNDIINYVKSKNLKINKLDNYFSNSCLDMINI